MEEHKNLLTLVIKSLKKCNKEETKEGDLKEYYPNDLSGRKMFMGNELVLCKETLLKISRNHVKYWVFHSIF